jgi:hypothetical protein
MYYNIIIKVVGYIYDGGEGGCAQRHNLWVNLTKKIGAISARARSAAKTIEYITRTLLQELLKMKLSSGKLQF